MKLRNLIWCFSVLLLLGATVQAQDSTEQKGAQEMPAMGPPEQMNEITYLVGEWDAVGKLKMDITSDEWTDYAGTCSYELICGGAIIQGVYKMPFMGMEFVGSLMQSYDRETEQWQMTWADNIGGRQSYYSGFRKDGKTVLVGEEKYQGMTTLARMTTFNETETSYNWTMEQSADGGKSWIMTMDAIYTKK